MRERGLTGVDGRRELEQEVLVLEVRPRARDERRAERAGRREHRNRKRKDRARLSRQANLPPQLGDRYHSAAPPTRSRYRHRNTDQHTTDALHHLVQLCPGPGAGQRESPAPPLPRTAEKSARNRRALTVITILIPAQRFRGRGVRRITRGVRGNLARGTGAGGTGVRGGESCFGSVFGLGWGAPPCPPRPRKLRGPAACAVAAGPFVVARASAYSTMRVPSMPAPACGSQ